ncbi:hypothetical protein D3C77_593770 [compost metagenome]
MLADFAHGFSLYQQLQYFLLPLRQFAQLMQGRLRHALRTAGRLRIAFAARHHQADGRGQRVGAGRLGQIARHARPRARAHYGRVERRIQHQHQTRHEERHGLRDKPKVLIGNAATTDHQQFHWAVDRTGHIEQMRWRNGQDVVGVAHPFQHMLDGDA